MLRLVFRWSEQMQLTASGCMASLSSSQRVLRWSNSTALS